MTSESESDVGVRGLGFTDGVRIGGRSGLAGVGGSGEKIIF